MTPIHKKIIEQKFQWLDTRSNHVTRAVKDDLEWLYDSMYMGVRTPLRWYLEDSLKQGIIWQ